MTSHPIDISGDCRHSAIEHLGNDRDARFYRCQRCGYAFVIQGGLTLAIPAGQEQRRPGSPARSPEGDAFRSD